ncbi:MAG: hypothetical protein ACXVCS_06355 [Bdellovibrionota bacterium]
MKAILLLLASTWAFAGQVRPLDPSELRQYQTCEDDSNCIRVTNGCCDCANGGDTAAINRKFDKQFQSHFDCRKIICSQKAGACNFREPVCVNGFCALGPQRKLFPRK